MHIDESPVESNKYDLIIGRDLLYELGIIMDFSTASVTWDNAYINMQDPRLFQEMDLNQYEQEFFMMYDPETTEADRIQMILELKYSPENLNKEVEKIPQISPHQKGKILDLLNKYKHLFDGKLGHWKTDPVDLILKEPQSVPVYQKPYPVPKSKEQKLK